MAPLIAASATSVTVPQTTGNDNQIVTANGDKLLVRAQTSCAESTSLLWFTPSTNAVQMLIRAPAGMSTALSMMATRSSCARATA